MPNFFFLHDLKHYLEPVHPSTSTASMACWLKKGMLHACWPKASGNFFLWKTVLIGMRASW
jgi:hypothetical protein